MQPETSEKRYKLREGVFIAPDGVERIYVGLPHRGVSLAIPVGQSQSEVLDQLNSFFLVQSEMNLIDTGNNHHQKVDKVFFIDHSILMPFIESCSQLKLIDEVGANFPFTTEFSTEIKSAQSIFFQQLYQPEKSLEAWRHGSKSDDSLSNRSQARIAIYGENRLALALITTLINSGYQVLHLSPRAHLGEMDLEDHRSNTRRKKPKIKDRIETNQLCGIGATVNDVGISYTQFVNTHMENSGWSFARPSNKAGKPTLIIATSQPYADHLQQWMSDSIPHILVSNILESFVEIGPVVIPGKTACYRCINLWKIDLHPHAQRAMIDLINSARQEMSAGAVALIAGHLLLSLNTYFSREESCLDKSNSVRINLFDPCSPSHISWQPHSMCGCLDLD